MVDVSQLLFGRFALMVLTLIRRGPPGIVRCTISKKSQDAMKKHQEEKKKRREERKKTEQARMSLEWKKKAEEILMKASRNGARQERSKGESRTTQTCPMRKEGE
jgi:formylmethanofuran dehydrogenase subunit E